MGAILRAGLRRLSPHKKGIILAYSVNVLVAAVVLVPFMQTFEESVEGSLYDEKLLQELDYDWYLLFKDRVSGFASTFSPGVTGYGPFFRNLDALLDSTLTDLPALLVALGFLYALASSYVTAAFVGSLAMDPEGTTTREFLRTGGEFFGRFFRLSLMSILTFFAVNNLILDPVRTMVDQIVVTATTDRIAFYWEFGLYCLILPLFLLVNLVFDYAKIICASGNRTSSFLSLCAALRFALSHLGRAFGLYTMLGLLGILGIFVTVSAESRIPQEAPAGILIAIAIQQTYVLFRLGLRLYFYSAQMQFYLDHEEISPGITDISVSAAAP